MRRKKTRKAVRRPDLSALKEAIMDKRAWCALGKVIEDDAGGAHFEIIEGEVIVDVELQPSLEIVSPVVSSPMGGNGSGIFSVPPVGSEVIVAIPEGEMFFHPTIVGVLTSGTSASGLSDSTIVIVAPPGGEVLIHDGDNSAEPLVRQSDFENHTHPTSMGPSSAPIPASLNVPPYTKVLKGK